jgi:7-cyano-7-deazaguanine synthase in queuosine biosynthesis
MKKTILQAISGGYDSTYLLIKNLQNGDNVYPMYISTSFIHPVKQKIEYSKVKSLVKKLQKRYKNLYNLIESNMMMYPIWNIVSTQPLAWIISLFREVKRKQYSIKYDEVQIGYIKSDCAIKYLSAIRNMWNILFSFSDTQSTTIPRLYFPLSKNCKKYIIEKLRNYDENILAFCWTCENPKIIKTCQSNSNSIEVFIEACGSCLPCKNLKKTNKIKFNTIKKYKASFNYKKYLNKLNTYFKNIIKNEKIEHIYPKFISLKYANKKLINSCKK